MIEVNGEIFYDLADVVRKTKITRSSLYYMLQQSMLPYGFPTQQAAGKAKTFYNEKEYLALINALEDIKKAKALLQRLKGKKLRGILD